MRKRANQNILDRTSGKGPQTMWTLGPTEPKNARKDGRTRDEDVKCHTGHRGKECATEEYVLVQRRTEAQVADTRPPLPKV